MQRRQALKVIYPLLGDLKSCSLTKDLDWARSIHAEAVESQNDTNKYIVTALMKMYAKCGSMDDTRRIFDTFQEPDVVFWNVLLMGYAENGQASTALDMFSKMKTAKCSPSPVTYVAAVKACTTLAANGDAIERGTLLDWGREIHLEAASLLDNHVQSSLVCMYAKCRSMVEARNVFDIIKIPDVVSWSAIILGYAENGEGYVALELFSKMMACGCEPNSVTYIAALKACTTLAVNGKRQECLEHGKRIHSLVGSHLGHYVQTTLIDMYSKCGSMVDARCVFDSILKPDVVSWNSLLLGYAENGEENTALSMFSKMKARGFSPNSMTYAAALKACTSLAANGDASVKRSVLDQGRELHLKVGCHSDPYIQNTVIEMYAKCGSMGEAREVFDSVLRTEQKPDAVCWNVLILGYVECGEGLRALELFTKMKSRGCLPNSGTYVAALKACSSIGKGSCLERCRAIHAEVGCHMNHSVSNTLIDIYAKCGRFEEANQVFDSMDKPDVVSWTALIMGYADNGDGWTALDLFSRMLKHGCRPDNVTNIAVLKACSTVGALSLGRKLHKNITYFTSNLVTCLVDFYAKCGSIDEARQVFDLHSGARTTSTWTALLAGYSSFDTDSVFILFEKMQDDGFRPDAVTFLCLLLCCSHAGLVEKAKEYFESMHGQYGVAPTLVHYSCMVDVLGRANQLNEAMSLLQKMPYHPDAMSWRPLLGACHKWKNLEIARLAFQSLDTDDVYVYGSAYILMAHIYSSKGMWLEQEMILKMRMKLDSQHRLA